jgi:hypothetical protein
MNRREKNLYIGIRVSPQERECIEQKMVLLGTRNMSAYIRKMAIDGQVFRLEVPELREIVRLLRYTSNNLNQLTKRAYETGAVYAVDIEGLRDSFDSLWEAVNQVVAGLARL